VGQLINGFEPGDIASFPTLNTLLEKYAEALAPWAARTAKLMLGEVSIADDKSWRELANSLSIGLRQEILNAPTGRVLRDLLSNQVDLIQSIPRKAAERVHELTLQGLEDSTRATEIAARIRESGPVAESRAMLIARTEVARTASTLTQARAESVGSVAYVWETSKDGAVRPSHRKMQGSVVRWDAPPTLDDLTGHAGQLPNCRCWPRPVLPM
jgi:SPP1 gp7 family putative phage head morphogenesis protein